MHRLETKTHAEGENVADLIGWLLLNQDKLTGAFGVSGSVDSLRWGTSLTLSKLPAEGMRRDQYRWEYIVRLNQRGLDGTR